MMKKEFETKKKRWRKHRHRLMAESSPSSQISDSNHQITSSMGDSVLVAQHHEGTPPADDTNGGFHSHHTMVETQKTRVRPTVGFVYSRSHTSSKELVPYVFDRQRKRSRTSPSSGAVEERSQVNKAIDASKPTAPKQVEKLGSQSIDDILFGTTNKTQNNTQNPSCKDAGFREDKQAAAATESASVRNIASEDTTAKPTDTPPIVSSKKLEVQFFDELEGGRQLSGLSVEDALRDKPGCRPRANSTDGELNLPRRGLCDEHTVLECFTWKEMKRKVSPRGFVNCGNTCFLNATLQCLAYLPPFSQCLMSLSQAAKGSNATNTINNGQRITRMLGSLFRQVHGLGQQEHISTAISPRAIVKAVPTLGSGGSRSGYKFRPGRQEDAHEFLVHLLDAMHDGELQAAGINQHVRGWRDKLPIPRIDETTLIHRVFGGYLRSQVKCTKCGHRSNTYDPFLDLSLEVSRKSCNSIESAFADFTKKETLDSENRWKCSGCKKRVCASKQLTVFRPPLCLCIQLKRFTFGGGFGGFASYGSGGWSYGLKGMSTMSGGGSKITKPIDFPAELKLPLSDGRKCEYYLTGIVIHVGGSASSGHYTAYVKRPAPPGTKAQWYHMDDSFVEPVSEQTALRHRDAYVLFYCRKEVKLEFPSPPPRASMSADEARERGIARARARANSITAEDSEKTPISPTPLENVIQRVVRRVEEAPEDPLHPTGRSADSPDSQIRLTNSGSRMEAGSILSSFKPTSTSGMERDPGIDKKTQESSRKETERGALKSGTDSCNKTGNFSPDNSPGSLRERQLKQGLVVADSRSDDSNYSHSDPSSAGNQNDLQIEANSRPTHNERSETNKSRGFKGDGGKARLVLDRGKMKGRLEVSIGPRYKGKVWKPKAQMPKANDEEHDLLGTIGIGRWDDMEGESLDSSHQVHLESRRIALKDAEKVLRNRKRKMHLDRWETTLDEGKKKKIKDTTKEVSSGNLTPKKNPFQRIQSSIQKMNRGRAKGAFRHGKEKHSKSQSRRASF